MSFLFVFGHLTIIYQLIHSFLDTDSPRDSVQFMEWSPAPCPRALLIANFHGRITIWTQPSQVRCYMLVGIYTYLTHGSTLSLQLVNRVVEFCFFNSLKLSVCDSKIASFVGSVIYLRPFSACRIYRCHFLRLMPFFSLSN